MVPKEKQKKNLPPDLILRGVSKTEQPESKSLTNCIHQILKCNCQRKCKLLNPNKNNAKVIISNK